MTFIREFIRCAKAIFRYFIPKPITDVHISAALTAISVAYLQNEDHYIEDKIFPNIPMVHPKTLVE